jgi:drug/metabolite transporter (DMT)-like permease
MQGSNLSKALLLTLLTSLFGSLVAAGTKFASGYISIHVIVFAQYAIGCLLSLPVVLRQGEGMAGLATQRFPLHLFRGIAGLISFYAFYLALMEIPLVDASLLRNSAPLCVPLVALIGLRISIARRSWWPLIVGFAGVLCILRPGGDGVSWWHLLGLCSGLLLAVSMVTTRLLVSTEPTGRVLFYYFAISLLVTLPMAVIYWEPAPWYAWMTVLAIGFSISLAMSTYTRAFFYAKPSVVSPVSYFGVVFAGLWGWMFWDQIPDMWTYAGVGLVVFGAVLTLLLGEDSGTAASSQ